MTADKSDLRKHALACRAAATPAQHAAASARLNAWLRAHHGTSIAGYHPMRGEADPLPALTAAAAHGPVGLPVILAKATPLRFRRWQPGTPLIPGSFGALIPETGDWLTPTLLIVPLVAFDRNGGRLGYGGGFYDRTLALLRQQGPTLAIGFALACQELPTLPQEPTDQRLDLILTDVDLISPTP